MGKQRRRSEWVHKSRKIAGIIPRNKDCRIPEYEPSSEKPLDPKANFVRVIRPGKHSKNDRLRFVGTMSQLELHKRTNTPGELLVSVEILPASNEYIDFMELYDDSNGNPGSWVGDLWFDSMNGDSEVWKAYDMDISEPHPVDGDTYHVVAWVTVSGFNSTSGTASRKNSSGKKTK